MQSTTTKETTCKTPHAQDLELAEAYGINSTKMHKYSVLKRYNRGYVTIQEEEAKDRQVLPTSGGSEAMRSWARNTKGCWQITSDDRDWLDLVVA
ncbi:hypothetical protein HZ326_24881 [Fusarium oxysporum f. sp. albedinis]|nr:hypothetical protein HZ326_24881 [Fusarium oxysporum f. sp. albedinis]